MQQPAAVPGTPITATAFIVQPSAIAAMLQEHPEWANALPSDRYVRIIVAGLKHFGADQAWIDWISAQPCKHGRQPHEYLKFPAAQGTPQQDSPGQQQLADGQQGQQGQQGVRTQADLPVFTMQQLAQHEGQLVDNKAIFAVGPKVVEMDISCKPTTPFANIIQKHFSGKQVGDRVWHKLGLTTSAPKAAGQYRVKTETLKSCGLCHFPCTHAGDTCTMKTQSTVGLA